MCQAQVLSLKSLMMNKTDIIPDHMKLEEANKCSCSWVKCLEGNNGGSLRRRKEYRPSKSGQERLLVKCHDSWDPNVTPVIHFPDFPFRTFTLVFLSSPPRILS